jgi:hypothetical protein
MIDFYIWAFKKIANFIFEGIFIGFWEFDIKLFDINFIFRDYFTLFLLVPIFALGANIKLIFFRNFNFLVTIILGAFE